MSALTAGSLFSGIGGIDVAFAAAGFDIRFQVEIDPFCRKVLAKHAPRYWPNAAQHVDIRDVGRAELGYVDVLFGGFPCQDISVAGNGAGLEGERSGLWYEFRRLIGDLRPRVVFIENVPAITGRGGATVIAHLAALGYDARWGIVGAADAGAPHQRDRWFCLAYASGIGYAKPATAADDPHSRVGHGTARKSAGQHEQRALITDCEVLGNAASAGRRAGLRLQHRAAQSRRSQQSVGRGDWQQLETRAGAVGRYCLQWRDGATQSGMAGIADGLSGWLDRPQFPAGSGQPQHAWEPPRVTDGTPDRPARVKALGNAVVPQVVYPFAVEIARMLFADAESEAS